jgi:phospholipid transport system substrate-binding protein
MVLKNSSWIRVWSAVCALVAILALPSFAHAEDETADAFVKRLSVDVLDTIKKDKGMRSGDIARVITLVDTRIMPNVDFQRMTSSAVGPSWRQATPEQQKRLQDEFKILLVRTYAGALSQVSDQVVFIKPVRIAPEDKEVIVRTEVRGGTDPIQLEYRMERTPNEGSGWKIYNINVLGVWLVETYKSQFTQIINTKGIDGLIESLVARNKTNTSAKKG